ncbi:uncharacterized protein LOC143684063 isoform X1 [Tamandua tetradactyla]|uniref:uncharacterized protein LOC143684063 isoform X1 n=1 Tax=Tamandua tetradactyla TaxID=48850 RepID=UPI0040547A18
MQNRTSPLEPAAQPRPRYKCGAVRTRRIPASAARGGRRRGCPGEHTQNSPGSAVVATDGEQLERAARVTAWSPDPGSPGGSPAAAPLPPCHPTWAQLGRAGVSPRRLPGETWGLSRPGRMRHYKLTLNDWVFV